MSTAQVLIKESITSLSEIQKNPARALSGRIVRIVKNGKEIGIYMSKEEFEDLLEENLSLKKEFEAELKTAMKLSKKEKLTPLRF